ncbi:MAG: hypothetical protein PHW60_12180 [Kiritimatiellae bacterium]|nr:hypothetical protein [Kiritimatiellia bacterium]
MSSITTIRGLRYEGRRWRLIFGVYEGVEAFAVNELQRQIQACFPYVIRVDCSAVNIDECDDNIILIGTEADNRFIEELVKTNIVSIPDKKEGYTLACLTSPWNANRRLIVIAGRDASGVLYAVEDFNANVAGVQDVAGHAGKNRDALETLQDFAIGEYPRVANRGIWTWGYPIYDYRAFIDNMARLRMNMLIVWNDVLPWNIRDIIDHAHCRGMKVILGFQWGWGKRIDLTSADDLALLKKDVLENYKTNYSKIPHDGIYFQTLTESDKRLVKGIPRAKLVCGMVNDIGRALLDEYPDLYIQFGIHATSILKDYILLKDLDERISLNWEDVGVIPYTYWAEAEIPPYAAAEWPMDKPRTVEETIAYSRELATLREGSEFAIVAKGFSALNFETEFEHHGPFILGERSAGSMKKPLVEKQANWDRMNETWSTRYPLAVRFMQEILACSPRVLTVTALVENGLFEERIQPCVALFADILWNPDRKESELLQRAQSPYYRNEV